MFWTSRASRLYPNGGGTSKTISLPPLHWDYMFFSLDINVILNLLHFLYKIYIWISMSLVPYIFANNFFVSCSFKSFEKGPSEKKCMCSAWNIIAVMEPGRIIWLELKTYIYLWVSEQQPNLFCNLWPWKGQLIPNHFVKLQKVFDLHVQKLLYACPLYAIISVTCRKKKI